MRISVDDGCESDLKIANLAKKYEIECVFYWPVEWHSLAVNNNYFPLTINDAIDIARSFEIGSHTITHRHLTKLPEMEAMYEIAASKVMLEDMLRLAYPITKFAPPRGYTNKILTELTDRIYESQRLTKGKNLVHIHPNSGANNNRPWLDCINDETKELWCHSWELNKYNLWDELEDYLRENIRG